MRLSKEMNSFSTSIRITFDVLRYIAALACVVSMLLYVGFGHDSMDMKVIMKIIRAAQFTFIANIVFYLLFDFPGLSVRNLRLQRIVDIFVLITVIPLVWHPETLLLTDWLRFIYTRKFLFICLGIYSVIELSYGTMQLLGRRTNPSLILTVSFLVFIFIGSFVLMLPKCTVGPPLRYVDSLFMAASAVSMTGLSTIDSAAQFTPMGWAVIAVLMQIGALGVLTFTSFFALFFSGRTSIYNQMLMRDFVYSKSMNALFPVILYILSFTLVIELIGAVGLYFTLPDDFSGDWEHKALFALFHSMSAFCNCGFTTLPQGFADPHFLNGNQLFYIVITVLILAGGIGFPNLVNMREVLVEYFKRLRAKITGRRYEKKVHVYDLNTKLVLICSIILFVGGAMIFYFLENNHAFAGIPTQKKIVQAVFCSATVRTAGFLTYGPDTWLCATLLIALLLMWIGCASQSMGGGIKINTFAAIILNLRSIVFGQKGVTVFDRTISLSSVRRANAVVCLFIFALILYSFIMMLLEPQLSGLSIIFECFSALTTVGISAGITPEFGDISKIILASAMLLGRVGIISVLCGVIRNRRDRSEMLPTDDLIIN